MIEPTIICPNCKTEIKLTESLAAPLLASPCQQFEQQLAQKETQVSKREAAVRAQQAATAEAQETIDEQVAAKLKVERAGVAATACRPSTRSSPTCNRTWRRSGEP